MIASPSKTPNGIHRPSSENSTGSALSALSSSDKDKNGDDDVIVVGGGKKRSRESDISTTQSQNQGNKKKVKQSDGNQNGDEKKERGIYCHICRRACEPKHYLTCTSLKAKTATTVQKPCNLSYCERDLNIRYDIPIEKINDLQNGNKKWECPCCKDDCQSSLCRKKKGLEPLGNMTKAARASNVHSLEDDSHLTNGHYDSTSTADKGKAVSTTNEDIEVEVDSDLSDEDEEPSTISKKKRGRPSKVNGDVSTIVNGDTPQAKKRGRPSKANTENQTSMVNGEESTTPAKKRGRPPKVKGDISLGHEEEEETENIGESITVSDSTDLTDLEAESSSEPKTKRGRPSKVAVDESPKKESDIGQKKRGRPSKVNGDIAEEKIVRRDSILATPRDKKIKAESSASASKVKKIKGVKKDGALKKKPGPKTKNTPVVEIEGSKVKKNKLKEDGKATPKKGDKEGKAKSKQKEKKTKGEVEKKIKLKLKKPEIIPEPPIFEKGDTKLGREEAEQRIMLREYLFRFRAVLSFPERALPAVDDFDRPLTEASVRLFAGAMLDMIKDELEGSENEELAGTLFNVREELRYYADLARFQSIFNVLSEPLSLRLPPPIIDQRAEANNSALRAILDLDDNQAAPAWATELTAGPSRRTAASRIPPPNEVIRMLLAFADRTLSTPKIRSDMESLVPENDMRRKHASAMKKETAAMEQKKKKLNEARLKCKTAAETKAHKEEYDKEMKDCSMRIEHINVNLEAQLARRALRHEPLGIDLDGRIYYHLAPREIEEQGRPPLGWASGLLVWGIGIEGQSSGDDDISGLPSSIERWSYFGKSKDVKQLITWIEWRFKKQIESMKSLKSKSPMKPKTPLKRSLTSTPSKGNVDYNTKTPGSKMKQRTLLEVVIPTSSTKLKFNSTPESNLSSAVKALGEDHNDDDDGDDGSSTSSGLTPPPTSNKEELLSLLNPKDYEPTIETVQENATKIVDNLNKVLRWLEVLEWQGYGVIA